MTKSQLSVSVLHFPTMNPSHFSDTPSSPPTDSSCGNRFDNRNSNFDFKNPRFWARKSYPRIPLSVNRYKPYIPYKSQPCLLFKRGKCYYGEKCHFSHTVIEISNQGSEPVAVKGHLNDSKRNTMSRVRGECVYFSNGIDCPYGEKCQFIHKCDQKVKRDRVSCAINAVNAGTGRNGSNQIPWRSLTAGERDYDKLVFRKTKLCNNWEWFGKCPYEERCTYAHGKAELQELGFPSRPNNSESSEVASKIAKKLELKGRSYFTNWDIARISQIYADN